MRSHIHHVDISHIGLTRTIGHDFRILGPKIYTSFLGVIAFLDLVARFQFGRKSQNDN